MPDGQRCMEHSAHEAKLAHHDIELARMQTWLGQLQSSLSDISNNVTRAVGDMNTAAEVFRTSKADGVREVAVLRAEVATKSDKSEVNALKKVIWYLLAGALGVGGTAGLSAGLSAAQQGGLL